MMIDHSLSGVVYAMPESGDSLIMFKIDTKGGVKPGAMRGAH